MNTINIFFRLSLFFLTSIATAVNVNLDSLRANPPTVDDTNKVLQYFEIARLVDYEDKKSMLKYINKAILISEKINYPYGIAKSYEYLAQISVSNKQMVQSLEYSYKALDIYNQNRLSFESAHVLVDIASILEHFSDLKSAVAYVQFAEKTLYKHPQPRKVKEAINYLLAIQLRLKLLSKAKRVIKEYNPIFDLSAKTDIAANAMFHNHVCNYYLATNNISEAVKCAHAALKYLEVNGYSHISTYVYTLNNLGNAHKNIGNNDTSIFYLKKSLKFSIINKLVFWQAIANKDIASYYIGRGMLRESIQYANKYKQIADSNYYAEDSKNANLLLAELHLKKTDYYQAYGFMKNYVKTADSLMKIESLFIINNLLYKHGLEKAEELNEVLITENKKKDLIIRDKQVLQFGLITGTFIIFVFAIFVIFLFVKYRINNNLLKVKTDEAIAQNEILENQNGLLEKLNEDKNGIIGVVSHDLKAPLNRIEGLLNLIYSDVSFNKEQSMYVAVALKELVEAKEMIKKILDSEAKNTDEKKLNIEKVDLVALLDGILENYQIVASNKSIKIRKAFTIRKLEIEIDKNYLIRIVDNLLSNAIKFSESYKSVTVNLIDINDKAEITILDEGPGFTDEDKKNIFKKYHKLSAQPTRGENSTGLGLHIVDKLTKELQGALVLLSEPDNGSTFSLIFNKKFQPT